MGFSYTGVPGNATAGAAPTTTLPSDGDADAAATFVGPYEKCLDEIAYLKQHQGLGLFGDGSDGAAILDGVNTYAWANLSSNVYTLIRDVYLSSLTVGTLSGSATLNTGGFRLYVSGTLTTTAYYAYKAPIVAQATSINAGYNAGTIAGAAPGGAAVSSANTSGNSGTAVPAPCWGGHGGNGGTSGDGTHAGGSFGTGGFAAFNFGSPRASFAWAGHVLGTAGSSPGSSSQWLPVGGGTGGGSGGVGNTGGVGGAGGAGGGVLFVAARILVLNAATDLQAPGNAGANGTGTNAGGGGGGGGGVLILGYSSKALAAGGTPTFSGAANCPVGAAGTGVGTGGNGGAAIAGNVFEFQM